MKIKICGLFRACDIDYVNEAMPDFIGFVFAKSRRQVSFEQAKALRDRLRPEIKPVGVFVNEPIENIVGLLDRGVIEIAQLHGGESEEYVKELKKRTPKPVIKAVSVSSEADIKAAEHTESDFLLLDNGLGGTGKCFNWNVAGNVKKPFFLAGGLNTGNIEQAIAAAHPYAVDLSSGVETAGVKDRGKVLEIVRKIRDV